MLAAKLSRLGGPLLIGLFCLLIVAWVGSAFAWCDVLLRPNTGTLSSLFLRIGYGKLELFWSPERSDLYPIDISYRRIDYGTGLERMGAVLPTVALHFNQGNLILPFWLLTGVLLVAALFAWRCRSVPKTPFTKRRFVVFAMPLGFVMVLWVLSIRYQCSWSGTNTALNLSDGLVEFMFLDYANQAGVGSNLPIRNSGLAVEDAKGQLGLVGIEFRPLNYGPCKGCQARIPLWALVACLALALMASHRRHRRWRADRCHKCGYLLTANVSGICPECGTPIHVAKKTKAAPAVS